MSTIEARREAFRRFMQTRKLRASPWAKTAGVSEGAIRNYLKGLSASLNAQTSAKLAAAENVPIGALFGEHDGAEPGSGTAVPSDQRPRTWGEDVPVMGQARGGADGFFFGNGEIVDRVERPTSLRNVPDAYAVFMHGSSQEPRIRHGELCFVHPHQPPISGDEVVVQLVNGEGYIKTYLRRTADKLVCSQYNPPKERTWPAAEVKAVHRIVWIACTVR